MKQIRTRLTYANVMSTIAVFLVVGGASAFAASHLGKNTVGSKQLKANGVTAAKIKNNAVTTAKIADGAVISAKLANGSVLTGALANGAVTTEKLGDKSVTTAKLGDKSVTTEKLGDKSVTTAQLGDKSVTTAQLGENSVRGANLGPTTQIVSASVAIAASPGTATAVASCPAGTKVLSGGGGTNSSDVVGVESFQSGNGWLWFARNFGAAAHTIFATAVCLQA